jgi:hypothetical protein
MNWDARPNSLTVASSRACANDSPSMITTRPPINFSHQSVVTPHPPNHVLHDLMRRSDEILAPVAPFHTHCELQAEFFYTVAEWQLGVFRTGGTLHRLLGGTSVIYIPRHVQRLRAARPLGGVPQADAGFGSRDPEPSERTRSPAGRRHQDQRYGAGDASHRQPSWCR